MLCVVVAVVGIVVVMIVVVVIIVVVVVVVVLIAHIEQIATSRGGITTPSTPCDVILVVLASSPFTYLLGGRGVWR